MGARFCVAVEAITNTEVKNWKVIFVEGDRIVVYPLNDTQEHVLYGHGCFCEPQVEYPDGIIPIIVHNSFDGREAVEWAKEILKQT